MTRLLYKYRGINQNTKSILLENSIWYASIPTLNDPNEGLVKEITAQNAEEFVRTNMENQLSGFLFSLSMNRNPEDKRILRKLKNLKGFERKYKYMNSLFEQNGKRLSKPEGFIDSIDTMIKNVGILSLSANPLDTVMWAHYGDNHKGIVIGISDFTDEAYQPIHYVQQSEIPGINLKEYISVLKMYENYNTLEIGFNDSSLQAALKTKTIEWKNESEWRGIKEQYGLYPINGKISEIIFGVNCPQTDREEISSIVLKGDHNNITFREICRKPNNYELFIRDVSS
jgi:hypothetical protein